MIPITTRSSTSVKPRRLVAVRLESTSLAMISPGKSPPRYVCKRLMLGPVLFIHPCGDAPLSSGRSVLRLATCRNYHQETISLQGKCRLQRGKAAAAGVQIYSFSQQFWGNFGHLAAERGYYFSR